MTELRLADRPELPTNLRQLTEGPNSVTSQLQRQLGSRIHLLSAENMFGLASPDAGLADRLSTMGGREPVRFLGLRALMISRPIDAGRAGPSVVESGRLELVLFVTSLHDSVYRRPGVAERSDSLAGLYPVIGVELDEPIELDDLVSLPTDDQPAFRPRLV